MRAVYSRDFKYAYRFVSAEDKQLKEEAVYVRERGPFSGFALEAAKKLSEFIEFTPAQVKIDDNRARITLAFKAPDMNSLSTLLLDWTEERLNALPAHEQKKLLASIDALKRKRGLEVIEGQEEFTLVRESNSWRLFFDWASGVRVNFTTIVPPGGVIEAQPTIKDTVTQPNELFTIAYRVKNLTDKEVFARITHRVEPAALTEHLDVVECALLLPVEFHPERSRTIPVPTWSAVIYRMEQSVLMLPTNSKLSISRLLASTTNRTEPFLGSGISSFADSAEEA